MAFENEMKNMKGRIREAVYEGKQILLLYDWYSFIVCSTGTKTCSTYYFISYKSSIRFYIYCRPNIPQNKFLQTVSELERCVQEARGILL